MANYLGELSRRDLLRIGSAAAMGTMAAVLTGGAKPVRAQALSGPVPEVDRLAVRIVTDSYHHAFEPSRKVGEVQVQRYAFELAKDRPPRRTIQNEWGFALHLESARGSETKQVMIDFGYTPEVLNNNLDMLRIDPAQLDALVLSHGHYDHFGGMVGFLERHKARLKKGLPFYLGGEECFCTREAGVGDAAGSFGALDRKAIAEAGLSIQFADRPSVLAGHGFTTGGIAAASFERVLAPTRMSVGMRDGLGCAPEGLPEAKRNATMVPDDFSHEQATCYNVKGRGLVVMTSCGHRGVVNSVRRAMQVSGVNKVHAVIGGFHLAPHSPEYCRDTVMALKEINPDLVVPAHCTGETFIAIASQEMAGKVARSSTGTRLIFGG